MDGPFAQLSYESRECFDVGSSGSVVGQVELLEEIYSPQVLLYLIEHLVQVQGHHFSCAKLQESFNVIQRPSVFHLSLGIWMTRPSCPTFAF